MKREIFGEKVYGANVDRQTRCHHWHSPIDVIAIKFKCCGRYFPCYECHAELTNHQPEVWAKEEYETKAVLCGVCGYQLTINEYFGCNSVCPHCESQFNPGCANHYQLYFEAPARGEK